MSATDGSRAVEYSAVPTENINMDTSSPQRSAPRRRRKCVAAILLVAAACLLIALATFLACHYTREAEARKGLVPPDPELPLPPSHSVQRRFLKAAVCSDGRPCSEVGRESRDFCAAALGNTKLTAVPTTDYSLRREQAVIWCRHVSKFCRTTPVFCLYLQVFPSQHVGESL